MRFLPPGRHKIALGNAAHTIHERFVLKLERRQQEKSLFGDRLRRTTAPHPHGRADKVGKNPGSGTRWLDYFSMFGHLQH